VSFILDFLIDKFRKFLSVLRKIFQTHKLFFKCLNCSDILTVRPTILAPLFVYSLLYIFYPPDVSEYMELAPLGVSIFWHCFYSGNGTVFKTPPPLGLEKF